MSSFITATTILSVPASSKTTQLHLPPVAPSLHLLQELAVHQTVTSLFPALHPNLQTGTCISYLFYLYHN